MKMEQNTTFNLDWEWSKNIRRSFLHDGLIAVWSIVLPLALIWLLAISTVSGLVDFSINPEHGVQRVRSGWRYALQPFPGQMELESCKDMTQTGFSTVWPASCWD